LETLISREVIGDFRIVVVILYVVCGGRTPLLVNKQTIWQLCWHGDEKLIPVLKINILWDMADLIPYMVLT
jgi:hypothetical protein